MALEQFKKQAKSMPDAPGVYFFLGPRKEVLYIGKAASLRDRVRSYFASDISEVRSPLIGKMVEKARFIDWRQVDSVLEALILEANLIRSHKPKFNTDLKDDKSFNHVVLTREDFPRVLLMRGKDLSAQSPAEQRKKYRKVFGPFPHGAQLKAALRIVRKIFPYRDTCVPGQGKPCFNRQLGLCPGVCSGEISKQDYVRTIRHLILFFEGKKKALLRELEREMKRAAKEEAFERAAALRGQIFALQHIQDVSLIKNEYRSARDAGSYRIEAYDTAHLGGSATVGVMVVVEDGAPQKTEYRTFHIRAAKAGDDVGALREILSRRLAHNEWPYPRLIVIDGARAQMNAAAAVLAEAGLSIPLVGVVKDEHHRPRGMSGDKAAIAAHEQDILLANAEAHRFSISRHRYAQRRKLTESRGRLSWAEDLMLF